jgi:hypothetical protein
MSDWLISPSGYTFRSGGILRQRGWLASCWHLCIRCLSPHRERFCAVMRCDNPARVPAMAMIGL